MRLILFVLAVSNILCVSPCHSQDLYTTDWAGYIIVSDGIEKESVAFDVKSLDAEGGAGYKISMIHNDQDYLFENLDINGDTITFKLDTGSLYDCSLILQEEGSYSGDCIRKNPDDSNKKIFIMMIPRELDVSTEQKDKKNEE